MTPTPLDLAWKPSFALMRHDRHIPQPYEIFPPINSCNRESEISSRVQGKITDCSGFPPILGTCAPRFTKKVATASLTSETLGCGRFTPSEDFCSRYHGAMSTLEPSAKTKCMSTHRQIVEKCNLFRVCVEQSKLFPASWALLHLAVLGRSSSLVAENNARYIDSRASR